MQKSQKRKEKKLKKLENLISETKTELQHQNDEIELLRKRKKLKTNQMELMESAPENKPS